MDKALNLIWIDLEMTGLRPEQDFIIEIATLITDPELNILAEGPVLAVRQPDEVLAAMDDWNQKYHGQSGLIQRVRDSKITEAEAQRQTLAFLREWVDERASPMCGNSICQDRRFLARYMPELESFFHYRNLDVSSVKEIARRWKPAILAGYNKQSKHIALEDIKDSIEELAYYREHLFRLDD